MSVDFSQADKPFESQQELLCDFSVVLDLHIYYIYKYHSWVGPDSKLKNMMGVVVTREEFESSLLKAASSSAYVMLLPEEKKELTQLREYFSERLRLTVEGEVDFPLVSLARRFGTDLFEFCVIASLLLCELDSKYEKLYIYLQDDITKKTPTAQTFIRLFAEPMSAVTEYYHYFSDDGILKRFLCNVSGDGVGTAMLTLSHQTLDFLTEAGAGDNKRFLFDDTLHPLYINGELADIIKNAAAVEAASRTTLICLTGKKGSGRRFLIKHAAKGLLGSVYFLGASELVDSDSPDALLRGTLCGCVLRGDMLCITDFEKLTVEENHTKLSELTRTLARCRDHIGGTMFITSEEKWQDTGLPEAFIKMDFEVPETDEASRLILWERFMESASLATELDPREMAAKFRFTPGQIEAAVVRSRELARLTGKTVIDADLLHNSCYDQVVVGLNTLASPIKPAYSWDDLVLPEAEIKMLKDACAHVKYRHTVYTEWGFSKRASYGRGLSMLFSGPPGTGKTMAAQVVTNQLHMQMYKIQLSQIVSKYIGETEKNLRQVFTEAKNANCILFFDEMDALFGKRSEVKDSHDRHANIETAYLLQQMEEYDGVVLMATNLLQNIDEAFMRRINFVIAFPFPDVPTRKMLWKKLLDTKAPVSDDIDFGFLAESFKIAGGNIKNCVIHAAFLAAAERSEITMRHIVKSVVNEQRKNNVVVLREDLGEYADLVFGDR